MRARSSDEGGGVKVDHATRAFGLRFTTGLRLLFAFSALVCAFLAVLLFATSRLRATGRALEDLRWHDERLRVAIELESALRDAIAHQAQIVGGDRQRLVDYRDARERGLEFQGKLRVHFEEERGEAWAADVEVFSNELRKVLDDRIEKALTSGVKDVDEGERAHTLIMAIEDRLDDVCAREQAASTRHRTIVSDLQRSTLRWVLAFFVGAPVFAAAIGLYIRRSVARPVARLGEGAARLARGDLETRIEIDSADEFGALAAQFNAMTEALKTHQEKLVQSEKLAGVGRLAAGFAHELNNPLSVILGYIMIHRRKADGRLARDLAAVEQEAQRCRQIVRDLLELSRPGRLPDARPVDLRELCDEVVTALRESNQLAPSRVVVEGAAKGLGSRDKLRQVVVNLVSNAAEAAGAAGSIEVRVSASARGAEVEVSDSGPGISLAARERLFEPFFTTKDTGTGLGLAVSRAIARAHGGDIAIGESASGGARFTLSVPPAAVPLGRLADRRDLASAAPASPQQAAAAVRSA
jgi:two-component system NtrC family sensor kinase